MLNRRERTSRRQAARAARATEQGVAGHQAAMSAIAKAVYKIPSGYKNEGGKGVYPTGKE